MKTAVAIDNWSSSFSHVIVNADMGISLSVIDLRMISIVQRNKGQCMKREFTRHWAM